jgi:pyruvate/2-oxoglutarate dehydrogenase complex dihydrolipoamide acyltransferase (E2) component
MPKMGPLMTEGRIHRSYVEAGERFEAKTRLFDVCVDLSAAAPQDCPPIFHFVIVAVEAGWIRERTVSTGDRVEVGQTMLVATTVAEPGSSTPPDRDLRVAVAAIPVDPLFG